MIATVATGSCLFLLPAIPSSQAEFNLNFRPDEKNNNGTAGSGVGYDSNLTYVSCGMSFQADVNCGMNNMQPVAGAHNDGTSFYQRMFQDTTTGKWYYQVMVGDYYAGDNFAMEYIIAADTSSSFNAAGMGGGGCCAPYYRTASAYNGTTAQDANNQLYNMVKPYDVAGSDPLKSGTGTGNPTKVIMHQFMKDAESEQVFLKDTFANKPLISQITTSGSNMDSTVIMDLRTLTYSSMAALTVATTDNTIDFAAATGIAAGSGRHTNVTKRAGGAITNTLTVANDPLAFGTAGDYNYATSNQHSNLSAGQFTYTPGTEFGQSNGTYTYSNAAWGDVFQPSNVDYASFCDATQNPNWSGNGPCKNSNGTGGGGGWRGSGGGW